MENMEFLIELCAMGTGVRPKCRLHAEFSQQMIAGPSHSLRSGATLPTWEGHSPARQAHLTGHKKHRWSLGGIRPLRLGTTSRTRPSIQRLLPRRPRLPSPMHPQPLLRILLTYSSITKLISACWLDVCLQVARAHQLHRRIKPQPVFPQPRVPDRKCRHHRSIGLQRNPRQPARRACRNAKKSTKIPCGGVMFVSISIPTTSPAFIAESSPRTNHPCPPPYSRASCDSAGSAGPNTHCPCLA